MNGYVDERAEGRRPEKELEIDCKATRQFLCHEMPITQEVSDFTASMGQDGTQKHQMIGVGRITEACAHSTQSGLHLGSNLGPATNSHPGVSQAGRGTNACAVPRMGVEPGVASASMSWWTLKIPQCPL